MEKPTVENKVKEIAEAMGLTYLCESWFRANQAFDRFRRQGDRREVTQINYRVAFDKMDANLCIVTLSLTLQEQAGVCFDYGL